MSDEEQGTTEDVDGICWSLQTLGHSHDDVDVCDDVRSSHPSNYSRSEDGSRCQSRKELGELYGEEIVKITCV